MAVIAYTQALAREFGSSNINVNAIAPGRILTQFHKDWVENRKKLGDTTTDLFSKESLSAVMPLGRAQSPEDIGALAAFLASEDAKNITGQTIQCDGGQVMSKFIQQHLVNQENLNMSSLIPLYLCLHT